MKCDFVTDEMQEIQEIKNKQLILNKKLRTKILPNLLFNLSLTKQHRLLGLRPAGSYGPTGLRPGPLGPSLPATPGASPLALHAHPKNSCSYGAKTTPIVRGGMLPPCLALRATNSTPLGRGQALPPPPTAAAPPSRAYGAVNQKKG